MKYFKRTVIVKDYQGRNRKAVYVPQTEYVKTNDITPFNKGKRYHFEESLDAKKYLRHMNKDTVYKETKQLSSSEIYHRKSVSKYRR